MRFLAAMLLIVVLLAAGFIGYCYWGATMEIEAVAASVVPAVEAMGTYNDTVRQIRDETFLGTRYRLDDFIMPDGYTFLTLTVKLRNRGILPQDWIRIEVLPNAADIAQLYTERTPSLGGMSAGELSATVLMRSGASTDRRIRVTYYVLGTQFSVEHQMASQNP